LGTNRFEYVLTLDDRSNRLLSFRNLVELHVLNTIRRVHRIKLHKVRMAADALNASWQTAHPLAEHDILTDGFQLFANIAGLLTDISNRDQQIAFNQLLSSTLRRIDRHPSGVATRLFPFPTDDLTSPKPIEITPFVQFGRPCLAGTRIPTDILYSRHRGGESVPAIACDYDIQADQVTAAIDYEQRMRQPRAA